MTREGYTGADLFVDALEAYGVEFVFGNPGTTELPILRAIADSDLEYVLGLHEDIAVGMAGGYASTRRYQAHHADDLNPVGVVNLHVAPGLAHGLGNIQNAEWSGAPLVVTAGDHSTQLRHEEPILSGDLESMAEEFTKWSAEVTDVSALSTMVRRAFRVALTPPTGPVFLALPMDVMMAETDDRPERLGAIPTAGAGDTEQVRRAADILAEAEEPVLVLGDHVARSGVDSIAAAVDLAEATGAAVYSEMLTCEINYPPEHDQWISFLSPDVEMARDVFDTDTLVFVGCSTNTPYIPYDEGYVPADATSVHVNDEAWEIGKNHPADVAVIGDPGEVMHEITTEVGSRISETERETRLQVIEERRRTAHDYLSVDRGDRDGGSISKVAVAEALREVAADGYVVNESNTSKYPLLMRWALGPEQFLSNKNGGLGYGLPATVGAAIAMQDAADSRSVIGFIGDGSYLYYPQAMYSAARYDVDLTVVVPNNHNYRILKDGMLQLYGGTDADYDYVGMDIDPWIDIAADAAVAGASGSTVTEHSALESELAAAIDHDGPAVVDVHIDD